MIYHHPLVERVYRNSPLLVQNLLFSAYGFMGRCERAGGVSRRYMSELRETERWPAERLKALQDGRIRALVRHVYDNVPYYRRVLDERGLNAADIVNAEDLYRIPVLRKQDIRKHENELRSRNIPKWKTTIGRTGGSSGVPLKFSLDRDRVIFDHCITDRQWSWAGYKPGDRVALLRGLTIVVFDKHPGSYWRYDWAQNRIYFSGFHLSLALMPLYVEKLQELRPKFIAAYPSNIFMLARYMEQTGIEVPVQAVFVSSEVTTPTERKIIEKQFRCKVWDRYGSAERAAVSHQCEFGNYHQNVEFGVMQVDSPLGTPALPGQKGEIVQTSLTNFSMPLIRYAIEDVGYSVEDTCACGRTLPLIGPVDGRKDDVIVTADGRFMPRAGLDQIHEFVANLERCQLVQERLGELIVRVLPRPGFNDTDTAELISQLRKRLGPDTTIKVQLVDDLPLSATGKERFIVSRVDLNAVTGMQVQVR